MGNLKFKAKKIRKLIEQGEDFVIDLKGILDVVGGIELLEMIENLSNKLGTTPDSKWNRDVVYAWGYEGILSSAFKDNSYLHFDENRFSLHTHNNFNKHVVGTWKEFTKEVK